MTVPTGVSYLPSEGHGYPRPADLAWIAVAEWNCGTSDRDTASRVPGSDGYLRRGTPAASSYLALQKMRPRIERSNDLAPLSPFRSWLAASPIRPDMIFGKDSRQGREQDYSGHDHSVLPGGTRASRSQREAITRPLVTWRMLVMMTSKIMMDD